MRNNETSFITLDELFEHMTGSMPLKNPPNSKTIWLAILKEGSIENAKVLRSKQELEEFLLEKESNNYCIYSIKGDKISKHEE